MTEQQIQSLSDVELQAAAKEGLIQAAREFAPLRVSLDYETCWALVAMIQLAWSHPNAEHKPAPTLARDFAVEVAKRIATTPEMREIVRRGWECRGGR